LVESVLSAQKGLPTASFTFLRQLSAPAYTMAVDAVSWSYAGALTVVEPLEDPAQKAARAVNSAEEFTVADLDAVISDLKQAIDDELAIPQ
jgi:hypothetical protein